MNDHERFTLHWTAAQPVVGSYIASLAPDFQEAEDLLEEVALILLRKFSQYDEQRPFVAWALRVLDCGDERSESPLWLGPVETSGRPIPG